jgi:hypothetical protein
VGAAVGAWPDGLCGRLLGKRGQGGGRGGKLAGVNAEAAPVLEQAEGNAPDVEAAFAAAPPEMVAEILDGELRLGDLWAR